jgi:hypothetical protein
MYAPEFTDLPQDEEHFWEMAEQNLEFAWHVLNDHPLETKEDALSSKYRSAGTDGKIFLPGLAVVAYRRGTDAMDQRDYFFELGRRLLPIVTDMVNAREMTPEFVQLWGVLHCCHGYIASYLFDDGDNFSQNYGARDRAKSISVDAKRTWVARILRRELSAGRNRKDAERAVEAVVKTYIRAGGNGSAFPAEWFEDLLQKRGSLKTTYRKGQMPGARLGEWADREFELPPIDPSRIS